MDFHYRSSKKKTVLDQLFLKTKIEGTRRLTQTPKITKPIPNSIIKKTKQGKEEISIISST
jgi:hypothetical protein